MSRQEIQDQVPWGETISSMVEVETPGNIGLVQALQRVGYEITSQMEEEGEIVQIQARVRNPNNVPSSVALVFSEEGIFHASKYDSFGDKSLSSKVQLIKISVGNNEEVEFYFKGVKDPSSRRFIKLATSYNRQLWGNI